MSRWEVVIHEIRVGHFRSSWGSCSRAKVVHTQRSSRSQHEGEIHDVVRAGRTESGGLVPPPRPGASPVYPEPSGKLKAMGTGSGPPGNGG